MATDAAEQRAGLVVLHRRRTRRACRRRAVERDVVGLAGDHRRGGVGQPAQGGRRRAGSASSSRTWNGEREQRVADEDGVADAVHVPHGRAVVAVAVAVHDVVVDEREVVDQLDRHGARARRPPASAPAASAPSTTSAGRTPLPPRRRRACRRASTQPKWYSAGRRRCGVKRADRLAQGRHRPGSRRPGEHLRSAGRGRRSCRASPRASR